MRDEDYRREYLGQPFTQDYAKGIEEDEDDTYDVPHRMIIREITKIDDCAECPNGLVCLSGKPLANTVSLARQRRTSFLCSRCACFHMWWPEQRMHIVCSLLRLGTHVRSQQPYPSGIDHATVALLGPNADVNMYTTGLHDGEAPCADFWNNYDLVVPMHPLTDGHPKYEEPRDLHRYKYNIDEYDCIDYFASRVPREFVGIPRAGRFRERFAPISPFTLRRRQIGRKIGTHGRRRMGGPFNL